MKCLTCLFVSVAALASAQSAAQPVITLAGGGFAPAPPAQAVAPGQLLVISVYGILTRIPSPQVTAPTADGWPNSVAGVAFDLVQGNRPSVTPVAVRGIQQTQCGPSEVCSLLTSATLIIPFTLHSNYASLGEPPPQLRISENGITVGTVLLRPVSDFVHVLNTCDGTLVYLSAAYSVPQDVCTPAVMVGDKLNSLYNLAHAGDQLAMWLYGLGPISAGSGGAVLPENLAKPVQSFQLNFDYRPNVPASPAVPGFGVTAAPVFAAYTGGTYQINFVVPPVPAGTPACDGVKVKSNLTVTVTGANSFDAALLCVAS